MDLTLKALNYTYRHTLYASWGGYITQAIINNLTPLLFVTFQREFGISLDAIGLLISLNFMVQITVDLIAAKLADRIGWRKCIVFAHIADTVGLVCLGVLPGLLPNPYIGLIAAVTINAIGGGLIEVLISPIVESLPGEEKASAMSMLHSFYCWGHMAVVILSTLYFLAAGIENWPYLPMIWALVPLANAFLFARVPLRTMVEQGREMPLRKLFSSGLFWLLLVLMVSAGASEQAMSQWSSLFAELGLGVSKTVGDLLGPCAFALFMALSRTFYGLKGGRIDLHKALVFSSVCCAACYILVVFSANPLISLIGCALIGLFVGLMWPGVFSLSARVFPMGGTAMFAYLAFAGDVGCSLGPGLVGFISDRVIGGGGAFLTAWFAGGTITEIGLKAGLLTAIVFPVVLIFGVLALWKRR